MVCAPLRSLILTVAWSHSQIALDYVCATFGASVEGVGTDADGGGEFTLGNVSESTMQLVLEHDQLDMREINVFHTVRVLMYPFDCHLFQRAFHDGVLTHRNACAAVVEVGERAPDSCEDWLRN